MNLPLSVLEEFAWDQIVAHKIPAFIAAERAAHPTATDDDISVLVRGNVKHYIRGRIGALVDALWQIGLRLQVQVAVNAAMDAEAADSGGRT